jgi:hypothetical protein
MEEMNEFIKIAMTASITTLVTLGIASIFRKNDKIRNAATKKDLQETESNAKSYTDSKITDHEKIHKVLEGTLSEIKIEMREDNNRFETKLDKVLFLLAKK